MQNKILFITIVFLALATHNTLAMTATDQAGLFQFDRSVNVETGLPAGFAELSVANANTTADQTTAPLRITKSKNMPIAVASFGKTYSVEKADTFSIQNLLIVGFLMLFSGFCLIARFVRAENQLVSESKKFE